MRTIHMREKELAISFEKILLLENGEFNAKTLSR